MTPLNVELLYSLALQVFMIYNAAMLMIFRAGMALVSAAAGGVLCSFYWSADDAGSWTPWWEVIVWLSLTILGIIAGLVFRFPLSLLLSFGIPFVGMMPVAIAVHFLKKKHPEE